MDKTWQQAYGPTLTIQQVEHLSKILDAARNKRRIRWSDDDLSRTLSASSGAATSQWRN